MSHRSRILASSALILENVHSSMWEIRGGSRICGKGGGAAAVPIEDPLWNFKRGAQGACALFGPP